MMESEEAMEMITRLNALVRLSDLCIALLEAIQKMGYDTNHTFAFGLSFARIICFFVYLPARIAVVNLSAMFLGIKLNDRFLTDARASTLVCLVTQKQ